MTGILETPRLELSICGPEDLDSLHQVWKDTQIRRFISHGAPTSPELTAEVYQNTVVTEHAAGIWGLRMRGNPALIGFCAFRPMDYAGQEIVCGLLPQYRRRGLGTEAVSAILQHYFESGKFDRVFARVDGNNVASIQLVQRLGMNLEGIIQTDESVVLTFSLSR